MPVLVRLKLKWDSGRGHFRFYYISVFPRFFSIFFIIHSLWLSIAIRTRVSAEKFSFYGLMSFQSQEFSKNANFMRGKNELNLSLKFRAIWRRSRRDSLKFKQSTRNSCAIGFQKAYREYCESSKLACAF